MKTYSEIYNSTLEKIENNCYGFEMAFDPKEIAEVVSEFFANAQEETLQESIGWIPLEDADENAYKLLFVNSENGVQLSQVVIWRAESAITDGYASDLYLPFYSNLLSDSDIVDNCIDNLLKAINEAICKMLDAK